MVGEKKTDRGKPGDKKKEGEGRQKKEFNVGESVTSNKQSKKNTAGTSRKGSREGLSMDVSGLAAERARQSNATSPFRQSVLLVAERKTPCAQAAVEGGF